MNRINWKTTLPSFIIGFFFLSIAFRNVSFSDMIQPLKGIPLTHLAPLIVLTILGIVIRAWRWWTTLPEPHTKEEFFSAQRALGIGYCANNFIPRLGEILRIYFMKKETRRSIPVLASTVILDRFFLDLLALIILIVYALLLNTSLVTKLHPDAFFYFWTFIEVSLVGIGALLLLAYQPEFLLKMIRICKVDAFPSLYGKIERLTHELSLGMSSIKSLRAKVIILIQTVGLWVTYMAAFILGLWMMDIPFTIATGSLAFAISILGVILPAPGAIGPYHYFTSNALTLVLGLEEKNALAFAFLMHAVMFLTNTVYGFLCYLYSTNFVKKSADEQSDQVKAAGLPEQEKTPL
ncbi:MAG: hypothetical protein CR997_08670 [Acidobacteria bacterium]|nr:MAG: hypothetical protein CR997_08670 [Acidobacteriota bacterium]